MTTSVRALAYGKVPGRGIDAAPERRPGVPMEVSPPRPVGAAHWEEPVRQRDPGNILRRKELAALTPVFGNTIAPRGLSGLMRRAAYEIPEHRTSRWLLLMAADRVDAIEHRPSVLMLAVPPLAAGIGLALLVWRARRRRSALSWLR